MFMLEIMERLIHNYAKELFGMHMLTQMIYNIRQVALVTTKELTAYFQKALISKHT
jgi:hypothetical protein